MNHAIMARMASLASRCPRIVLALAVLAACKDDPPAQSDETTGTTGGSSSTTMVDPGATTNMTTAPPSTTVDPDDTTFGAGCGVDPCAAKCGDCVPTATCIASEWTCECDCDDSTTGDGFPCDELDGAIDAWVEPSKSPAVDCGSPDPSSDPFAWETLHQCSVIQAMGQGLRGSWTLGEGSDPFQYGVAARVGAAYELAWFERSSTGLVQYSCTAITATPDCVVDVESACLTCEGQTEVEVVCGEGSGSSSGDSGGASGSSGSTSAG
jgi:hypothetical protein